MHWVIPWSSSTPLKEYKPDMESEELLDSTRNSFGWTMRSRAERLWFLTILR